MGEDPTLPRLPFGPNSIFAQDSNPHKRVRSSPPVSSDPPLFSSDDDPSADNYENVRARQKKRFRGPWFKQELADMSSQRQTGKSKRTLERQFDSAVWLGSDSTDADDDADFSTRIPFPNSFRGRIPIGSRPCLPVSSQSSRPETSPEQKAREQIDQCLEDGKEDIDLSYVYLRLHPWKVQQTNDAHRSRGLTQLSNNMFKPLASFVTVPEMGEGVPFQNLRPALKIYLASNQLKRLPGEIFNLHSLSVLSLRSNELVELPSCIGKSRRLVELNIANNLLRFLPYEILDLFAGPSKLQILHVHPNPFYGPEVTTKDSNVLLSPMEELDRVSELLKIRCISPERERAWHPQWTIAYKCRSYVRFIDIDGTLVKGPALPGDEPLFISSSAKPMFTHSLLRSFFGGNKVPVAPHDDNPEPPMPFLGLRSTTVSHAPSLFEVAVKMWSQIPNGPGLKDWLGYDPPEKPARLLEDARVLRETEAGDRRCTICKRPFVIPRTEWIEWWQVARVQEATPSSSIPSPQRTKNNLRDEAESMIPFLRRGCSWKCLPEKVILRDEDDEQAARKVNMPWYAVQ